MPQGIDPSEVEIVESVRRLASQRDDLIAQGVDPSKLEVPLAPPYDVHVGEGRHIYVQNVGLTPLWYQMHPQARLTALEEAKTRGLTRLYEAMACEGQEPIGTPIFRIVVEQRAKDKTHD